MDKTLGQIAFESVPKRFCEWEVISPEYQKEWEHVAAAVAAAVKEEDARICANVCGGQSPSFNDDYNAGCYDGAAAIRASIKEVK